MEIICCSVCTRDLVELWLRTEDCTQNSQERFSASRNTPKSLSSRHASWQSGLAGAARAKAERLTKSVRADTHV